MGITTQQLDTKIRELWAARQDYDGKNETLKASGAICDSIESEVLVMLEEAGKDSYTCEGVARINRITKLQVKTPKDFDSKGAFFKWINQKFGAEGFLAYLNINSNTLNKLYNEEYEACAEESKASFSIAGIDSPNQVTSLRVTKHNKG